MNELTKKIIIGIVCFVIGVIVAGAGIYFYTQSENKRLNNIIAKTNESMRKLEGKLSDATDENKRLRSQIEASLNDTAELRTIIEESGTGIDSIIEINRRLREYLQSLSDSK